MSVSIKIDDVVKRYGTNTVIRGLSLDIRPGEFFTLLGPSGCGKTTLLRMIIGFNSIEGGKIEIGGRVVNEIPPSKRNIGMVFQNYAIFPHMSVAKNVAFGLRTRKIDKATMASEVAKILKTVKIDDLAERMPGSLSGGQQQRVALARAIVIRPEVLLMDEPLSNLDAKLRVEMRNAIKGIQKEIGITTVYVTHDQEEALAVSDRIAVMNGGVIQQIGSPKEIYKRPENIFVATFIGFSNIFEATLEAAGKGGHSLAFDGGYSVAMQGIAGVAGVAGIADASKGGRLVKVSVRPEEFEMHSSGEGIKARVESCVFLGLSTHYFMETAAGKRLEVVQYSDDDRVYPNGSEVVLAVRPERINVFEYESERTLMAGTDKS
jgi:iron(III) transport system ATP-binding protein